MWGNSKLGPAIWSWSLPAVLTCPGRSDDCEAVCYARRGHFTSPVVGDRLARNLAFSMTPEFAPTLTAEIKPFDLPTVRIHVSGDFYDAAYAAAWLGIVKQCRRTRFYADTRSWRHQPVLPALGELGMLKHFKLWLSADSDTGLPPALPGSRVAWLVTAEGEEPPREANLVFRTRRLRRRPALRLNLVVVCGTETGAAKADTTCSGCQRCWR
jgi:Gene product 88